MLAISRSSPRGQLNRFKLALQSEFDANVQPCLAAMLRQGTKSFRSDASRRMVAA